MFMHLLKYLAYLLLLFSFFSCGEAKQETAKAETAPTEQGIEYDATSVKNIQELLNVYYSLKDALVAADSAKAKDAAVQMAATLDTLQLQADTSLKLSSLSYPSVIKEASVNLSKLTALEEQRAVFETISDNLFELIQTLRPSGIETYRQYCPMAFNDKGAYWLSNISKIKNPYYGKKMLTCGEVAQELRYK
jgi:Cu(I)/Ag(I) efflux system membrane fusion protein